MTDQHFQEIIARYLNGEASPGEIRLIDRWYRSFGQRPGLLPVIPAHELRQSMTRGFEAVREAITPEKAVGSDLNLIKK